ncbi:MAG: hypothetical protein WCB46_10120, partial [Methanoregula sp.]
LVQPVTARPITIRMIAIRLRCINFDPFSIMSAFFAGEVWQNLICTFGLFSKIEKNNQDSCPG